MSFGVFGAIPLVVAEVLIRRLRGLDAPPAVGRDVAVPA
jgi:hypothetical protein